MAPVTLAPSMKLAPLNQETAGLGAEADDHVLEIRLGKQGEQRIDPGRRPPTRGWS